METRVQSSLQDLRYLSWAKVRNSSGTAGSFLKSYSDLSGVKIYYKLSNYDSFLGIVGHECVNELIVDRLLTVLGVEHLHYQLIHAKIDIDGKPVTTWLSASEDFKRRGESKIALDAYYQVERQNGESPLDFCMRNGWADYIYRMLVVDFLILNRDRHGANIEVLRDRRARTIRLAPLFDHGLSLLFGCTDEAQLGKADVMKDKPVQCWVGSRSALENLKRIPKDTLPAFNPLTESDRGAILDGLDAALPQAWLDKIWLMLWERWQFYARIRDQG